MADRLDPADTVAGAVTGAGVGFAEIQVDVPVVAMRIRDASGRLAGTAMISKPAAGMATLGAMASMADLGHLERMQSVSQPARRPAAVLFADRRPPRRSPGACPPPATSRLAAASSARPISA